MSFATPLGLLALLGVPAVLLLHMFRRRFKRRDVAGLFLFAPNALAATSGRKRTRLLRSASLWLELAAALLLALLLAGVSFGATAQRKHLVVVVDDSASMAATGPSGVVDGRVRAFVAKLMADQPASAVATVLWTGRRPEVACGPEANLAVARAALDDWRPRKPMHSPATALGVASELAGASSELWFLTDTPREIDPRFHVRSFGAAQSNTAIVSARRVRGASEERIFCNVSAFADAAVDTAIVAYVGASEQPSARQRLRLAPGKSASVAFTLPRTDDAVRLSLQPDALAIDNEIVLLHEPKKLVRIADVLGAERSALVELSKVVGALDATRIVRDPAAADIVVAAASGTLKPMRTEVVVAPVSGERVGWLGPFLLERRHPLLDGVTLDGVIWTSGKGALPGRPIASAGAQVLIAEERAGQTHRIRCNVDPMRSNLHSAPDWPIFLMNIVEAKRRELPGAGPRNVRIGDSIEYRYSGDPAQLENVALVTPDGMRLGARGARLLSWRARLPGVHHLEISERRRASYSVAFVDAKESDLTSCASAEVVPAAPASIAEQEQRRGGGAVERRWLAILLLLLLAADWFVLSRGRGV